MRPLTWRDGKRDVDGTTESDVFRTPSQREVLL